MGYTMDPTVTIHGPAPKEKEMQIRTGFLPRPEEATERKIAELEAVWENSRLAALAGFCASPHVPTEADEIAANSSKVACATLRLWPAMTAERDALIRKAVEG